MDVLRKPIVIILVTIVITILVVYLTPLKWLNLKEPTISDVLPTLFNDAYKQNTDKYIFIDVRPTEVYNASHAKGSINIPLHLLYDERKNLPKSGKKISLICSGGRASGVAYSYLEHFGFSNLTRISGGVEAWEKAGLPMERASDNKNN